MKRNNLLEFIKKVTDSALHLKEKVTFFHIFFLFILDTFLILNFHLYSISGDIIENTK